VVLALLSCDGRDSSSAADPAGYSSPPVVTSAPSTDVLSAAGRTPSAKPSRAHSQGLRFIAYNVENWLTMERFKGRTSLGQATKPEEEKCAVIRILAVQQPDMLGLCEVGTREDLIEIQQRMADAGVPLPHLHHYRGADSVRALGFLSRHPLTVHPPPSSLVYSLHGRKFAMNRGILDVSVHVDGLALRFLGAHLKSKREVEDGDQEAMRIHEARLLRQHVDRIFKANPTAPLVVYGDFNDTYPTPTVRTITSHPDPAFRLRPVYLRDTRREAWTHHWAQHDIYSRIDFVTLSRSLSGRVNARASKIVEDAVWDKASDHRPLLVVFR
jgi:endonuclease/exonuclease/phosphatase family metal-dependent hydrolase